MSKIRKNKGCSRIAVGQGFEEKKDTAELKIRGSQIAVSEVVKSSGEVSERHFNKKKKLQREGGGEQPLRKRYGLGQSTRRRQTKRRIATKNYFEGKRMLTIGWQKKSFPSKPAGRVLDREAEARRRRRRRCRRKTDGGWGGW